MVEENPLYLQTLVKQAIDESIDFKVKSRNSRLLVDLIKNGDKKTVKILYEVLAQATSMIKPKLVNQELLNDLISFNWSLGDEVVDAYSTFVINMVSAHPSLSELFFEGLVGVFSQTNLKDDKMLKNKIFEHVCSKIHLLLKAILLAVPSSSRSLISAFSSRFPNMYKDSAEAHQNFIKNLLLLHQYCPHLSPSIIEIAIDRILQLDVAINVDDLLDEEDLVFEIEENELTLHVPTLAHKLDLMMEQVFHFVEKSLDDDFFDLWLRIFDSKILVTHKSKFTQFIIFYICHIKQEYSDNFLAYLLNRVLDISCPTITRQTSAAYIGSFISRAKFVSFETTKKVLSALVSWLHDYLLRARYKTPDAEVHVLFYTVCQVVCYIICFHHKTLMENIGSEYFTKLQMETILISPLNPLKFCLNAVVREFTSICQQVGSDACLGVISRNTNLILPSKTALGGVNQLETFFPFDPYLLKTSSKKLIQFTNNGEEIHKKKNLMFQLLINLQVFKAILVEANLWP